MEKTIYPPGPKSVLAVYYKLYRDPLRFLNRMCHDYGDIAHIQAGQRHDFLINHPDYIKAVLLAGEDVMLRSFPRPLKRLLGNGLLTIQGEAHRCERQLLQPMFHQNQIAHCAVLMTEQSARFCENWGDGQTLDIAAEMLRLTMLVIMKALVNQDVEDQAAKIGELLSAVLEMTHKNHGPYLDELFSKLPLPRVKRYHRARAQLDALMSGMIAERKEATHARSDFLTEMLQLRDPTTGHRLLTDDQVRDEAMTMFAAGHETIGTALAWTWHLLASHPEVEERMHNEIDSVLGGKTPAAKDVCQLPYTGMVLSESMRIYPPVWLMARRPVHDFPLCGFVLPARCYIHFSQYLAHHDPRFFPNPEKFDPDRWTPEAVATRPKYSYFPFGAGSRRCIGESFARMEGVLMLATIAQRWQFRAVPNHPVELKPFVTLHPRYGLKMTAHARRNFLPQHELSSTLHTSARGEH
jgi:cytochrome P450